MLGNWPKGKDQDRAEARAQEEARGYPGEGGGEHGGYAAGRSDGGRTARVYGRKRNVRWTRKQHEEGAGT